MNAKCLIESLEPSRRLGLFTLEEARELIEVISAFGLFAEDSVPEYTGLCKIYVRKDPEIKSRQDFAVVRPFHIDIYFNDRRSSVKETFNSVEQLLSILADNLK